MDFLAILQFFLWLAGIAVGCFLVAGFSLWLADVIIAAIRSQSGDD